MKTLIEKIIDLGLEQREKVEKFKEKVNDLTKEEILERLEKIENELSGKSLEENLINYLIIERAFDEKIKIKEKDWEETFFIIYRYSETIQDNLDELTW